MKQKLHPRDCKKKFVEAVNYLRGKLPKTEQKRKETIVGYANEMLERRNIKGEFKYHQETDQVTLYVDDEKIAKYSFESVDNG